MNADYEKFGGPPVRLDRYRLEKPFSRTRRPTLAQLRHDVAQRRDPANAFAFFDQRRSDIPNPLADIPECARACRRLRRAAERPDRIVLYGDYDCDGVTSITLMMDALAALDANLSLIKPIIPDRVRDGYGLKWPKLEAHFRQEGDHGQADPPDLLIVLDCGSNSPREVRQLLDWDVDVIIIDHHHLDRAAPLPQDERVIHLNPGLWWNEDEKHTRYCAAGLTYFVADALHGRGQTSWNRERAILLAGLATCADVVPLLGVNRKLLKHSLSLARDPLKLGVNLDRFDSSLAQGLKQLADRMVIRGRFNEDVYGYGWGPCLNAPGRMGTAAGSVDLLLSTEPGRAQKSARTCLLANGWRKSTERAILNSAMRQAEALMADNPNRRVLFLCHPQWHPGVVGIVAARIRDRYGRPAFVSSSFGKGVWKGSARSIEACNLGKLLQAAKRQGVIEDGGGHEMAGGLTFLEGQRHRAPKWLEANAGITDEDLVPKVERAAAPSLLAPKDWAQVLKPLAPFGKDNPCPALFVEAAELLGVRTRTAWDPASGKRFLIGYEGLFAEISGPGLFFALWRDYELADLTWEVHRFLDDPDLKEYDQVRLDCHFRLEMELHGFISAQDRKHARGKRAERSYNFVVRQCRRIAKAEPSQIPSFAPVYRQWDFIDAAPPSWLHAPTVSAA